MGISAAKGHFEEAATAAQALMERSKSEETQLLAGAIKAMARGLIELSRGVDDLDSTVNSLK